jgi:cell wall-associated NlpC family hydrolase
LDIISILDPGDIILRGYDNYLDGCLIPDPLSFSHGAIYIGNGKIIHAVAEGVSETNVIEFTRCDRIAIFRPKRY